MRLIAHSFRAETFAIDRRLRTAHLERRLVVPDLASNVGKWQ
jgi:deoxyribodipyrimidine photolyase